MLLENFEKSILFSDDYYFNYYNEHLYKKDQSVKLKKGNMVFTTTIKEVNRKGQLVTLDTLERQFNNGEVKFSISSILLKTLSSSSSFCFVKIMKCRLHKYFLSNLLKNI